MDDLTVEVGIPTFNNSDTIKQTLESLTNQIRKPDRIIIVDNSDDGTPEIVSEFSKMSNVCVDFYKQSDRGRGVGGARQDIYDEFEGDLLLCLDTDSVVKPQWIKEHIIFHKKNQNHGILSNTSGKNREITDPKVSDYFGQSNCSIKKNALDQVRGWDPWFPRGEDWDMRIRLASAGVSSYAKNEINEQREKIGTEGEGSFFEKTLLWAQKKISAPSSALFLDKYGLWYALFHPLHIAADFSSIVSSVLIIISPILSLMGFKSLVSGSLIISLSLPFIYMYFKGPRKRDGFDPRKSDFTAFPIFFVLSISFLISMIDSIFNRYEWNYSGFKDIDDKSADT